MKHGAGGPKHSEEVSANQLLLRALAGQSPGAITPASSESLSRREEEEEEEEEKEGERKPRATPKEEREVAAGSGHCRDVLPWREGSDGKGCCCGQEPRCQQDEIQQGAARRSPRENRARPQPELSPGHLRCPWQGEIRLHFVVFPFQE
ncbi:uncharacterized protein LOC134148452 isoform X22 [Rhea pennata]|uniref:uncharacterized protein LOC134148452 isoform X22 n=1 Tax=Rhea pennata TaxID=8795 RepID=UPI002E259440